MKQTTLKSNEKIKILKPLDLSLSRVNNFNNLTLDDKAIISERANSLKEIYNYENYGSDYIYRLIYYIFVTNTQWKNTQSIEWKVALFIESLDPEFKMYSIYENNGNYKKIEEEIVNEFGIYRKKLLLLEKEYIKRFNNINNYNFNKKLELNKL
jgi:hypothetical protein